MGMDGYQNRKEAKDSTEDFPTPSWATRAMMTHIFDYDASEMTCWEPAANRGYMANPLDEFFGTVIRSDLIDYGVGYPVIDFLDGPTPMDYGQNVDWIFTNPPFNLAIDFVERAASMKVRGYGFLLRNAWLEGIGRYERLFSVNPPTIIAQYAERVPIVKGRVDKKAGTAMPYSWFIWDNGVDFGPPIVRWIPPCRKEFERDTDYPDDVRDAVKATLETENAENNTDDTDPVA